MLPHHLVLFLRSLKRNKLFAFINLLGLSLGFFAATVIFIFVRDQSSYDKFHEIGDRIYRVNQTFIWGENNPNQFASTGPGVAYSILEDVHEVEQVVRVHTYGQEPIRFEEKGLEKFFHEETIFAVDSNFFNVFSFPLKYGDPNAALKNPYAVVLTSETSIQLFGNQNPVGRLIDIGRGDERRPYKITGVMEEVNDNTYVGQFDLLISMTSISRVARSNWSWMWTMFETFIVLDKHVDAAIVQEKLDELPKRHAARTLKVMGYTYEEYIADGKEWNLYLQPLEDIYLSSDRVYNRLSRVGNLKVVIALVASGIFLLILSCINFINLSTAHFTSKAKDIALRKVLGGNRFIFKVRFFLESFFYCLIAIVVALLSVTYSLPLINKVVGTTLSLSNIPLLQFILFFVFLVFVTSLISGSYPFAFFNAFNPVNAMKGEFKTGNKGIRIRNGMLVTQYVVSFLLTICTLISYKQINFFLNADLGFEKEQVTVIQNVAFIEAKESFVNELRTMEGILDASLCDAPPLLISNGDSFEPDIPDAGSIPLNYAVADEHYSALLELDFAVGRPFDKKYALDTSGIIINESAAQAIGWAVDESILNKKISNWIGEFHIIGVVKDFNYWSLHAPVEPFAIFPLASNASYNPIGSVLVKTKGTEEDLETFHAKIGNIWDDYAPNKPFEYFSLNQQYESYYQSDKQFSDLLSFFAIITIVIASLGLLGIVIFSIEQKIKEVGVRKVLGASMLSIVILFSKSYVKLIFIGFILAVPASYFLMENWLSDYENRISIGIDTFVISLVILLVISLLISSIYSIRASLMNPAEVLKDE